MHTGCPSKAWYHEGLAKTDHGLAKLQYCPLQAQNSPGVAVQPDRKVRFGLDAVARRRLQEKNLCRNISAGALHPNSQRFKVGAACNNTKDCAMRLRTAQVLVSLTEPSEHKHGSAVCGHRGTSSREVEAKPSDMRPDHGEVGGR